MLFAQIPKNVARFGVSAQRIFVSLRSSLLHRLLLVEAAVQDRLVMGNALIPPNVARRLGGAALPPIIAEAGPEGLEQLKQIRMHAVVEWLGMGSVPITATVARSLGGAAIPTCIAVAGPQVALEKLGQIRVHAVVGWLGMGSVPITANVARSLGGVAIPMTIAGPGPPQTGPL
jgi:hypothetical protein